MTAMSAGTAPPKSCSTCPSFLKASESAQALGKSINSATCATFGFPLERPNGATPAQAAKIQESRAASCGRHGSPAPRVPESINLTVALPDLTLREDTTGTPESMACSSCNMCRSFVPDSIVDEALGWTAGLCRSKGQLVLANKRNITARDCEFRAVGPQKSDLEGVIMFPEYADGFGAVDVFKAFTAAREASTEPAMHPTDKPVTEDEAKDGILSWRKVQDPDGPKFTYLPIYDISTFTEEERKLVPQTGDPEHPEMYVDHFGGVYTLAVCWTELDETPAINGEAGTGKTELFRHMAWLMQLPFRRLSITGSTELDDLAGKMHYSPDKGTYFQYGRLPNAWMRPGVICIDEPNTGPPDVWQFLRPLTDNSKQLILDVNEGESINCHTDCYMGMAMNPAWDVKNVGTMQIGDADANRLFHIALGLPPEVLEREIIKERVKLDGWDISNIQLNMVMKIAKELRSLSEDGTLSISWALRPQIKVARALRWFEPIVAYRRAVGDYLEPEAQQALLDVVRSHSR